MYFSRLPQVKVSSGRKERNIPSMQKFEACNYLLKWSKTHKTSDYCWSCQHYKLWKKTRCSSEEYFECLHTKQYRCRCMHCQGWCAF